MIDIPEKNHFKMGRRNLDKENNWEQIDFNSYKVTGTTILCLGGNGTTKEKDANALCKFVEKMIKVPKSKCDIVGFSYGTYGKCELSNFSDDERTEIVQNIFMPLCFGKNEQLLDKKSLLNNFENLNFFCHCYGAKELSLILQETHSEMQNLGLSENLISSAFNKMFAVTYSPISGNNYIPTLEIFSMSDDHVGNIRDFPAVNEFLIDNRLNDKGHVGTVAFLENKNTAVVMASSLSTLHLSEHEYKFLDPFELPKNNFNVEEKPAFGKEISALASCTLTRAVNDSIASHERTTLESDYQPTDLTAQEVVEMSKQILGDTINKNIENEIESIKENLEFAQ